ncbi:hypothetical protein JNUCC64_15925 [Streptomyces sp. JNUCC 64]
MTRDALLLDGPPAATGAHCHVCGRWTTVPVVIGYTSRTGSGGDTTSVTHHTCPHHLAEDEPSMDQRTP